MIKRNGPRKWENIHITHKTKLDDLIDIDNSKQNAPQPVGFELFKQAAEEIDSLIIKAKDDGKRLLPLGSAWALSDINITDGWLLNTKLLNGIFDVADKYFEQEYPVMDRSNVIVAQCGASVGEINLYLEQTATIGIKRCLQTAGIGAGQTIAGAISGNTHGSAVNFGAMSDFVVGLQVATGSGQSIWLERESEPVFNSSFVGKIGAGLVRDDDLLNAAIVSFGTFGVISAVAIKTSPIFHLEFPKTADIPYSELKERLLNFDSNDPSGLYHFEFIFNPYTKDKKAMVAAAPKVPYKSGFLTPKPRWIARTDSGFTLGANTPSIVTNFPLVSAGVKARFSYKQYRKLALLNDVRGTPGQLFTATIFYAEGYTESALGIPIDRAPEMIDISSKIIRDMRIPTISQVRVVAPSRATLGFTYQGEKTAVFEYGLPADRRFPEFERRLTEQLLAADIPFTFHWSKNSGLTPELVEHMYKRDRVNKWKQARERIFQGDRSLMKVFETDHLRRTSLNG